MVVPVIAADATVEVDPIKTLRFRALEISLMLETAAELGNGKDLPDLEEARRLRSFFGFTAPVIKEGWRVLSVDTSPELVAGEECNICFKKEDGLPSTTTRGFAEAVEVLGIPLLGPVPPTLVLLAAVQFGRIVIRSSDFVVETVAVASVAQLVITFPLVVVGT